MLCARTLTSVRRPGMVSVRASHRQGDANGKLELVLCTNKTCKKQGSPQVLKFIQDLQLEEVEAKSCGCLGNCGNGPNGGFRRGSEEMRTLAHVATPADALEVLTALCGIDIEPQYLQSVTLRLAGNEAARDRDFKGAIVKYTEGISLGCKRGLHLLYSNRSAAHLQAGNKDAALDDAVLAVEHAPKDYHTAWVRLIDSYYALGRQSDAAAAFEKALASCPGFQQTPEYKAIRQALQKVLTRQRA